MGKPYPQEFRDDVVRIARNRDSKTTMEQIARDFGIHATTLAGWLRKAEANDQTEPGRDDQGEQLRELKRRNRLLEQENEVLRRAAAYLSQAHLPPK